MTEIYQEVSEDTGLPVEEVKLAMSTVFNWLRHNMVKVSHDKLLFRYLGTFEIRKSYIRKHYNKQILNHDKDFNLLTQSNIQQDEQQI
jgi:nucleoid DNA-binding protein